MHNFQHRWLWCLLMGIAGCGESQTETAVDRCAVSAQVRGSLEENLEWTAEQIECFGDFDESYANPLEMWFVKRENIHEMFIFLDVDLERTGTVDAYISVTLFGHIYSGVDAGCQAQVDTFRRRDDQEGYPTYEVLGTAECPNRLPDLNGLGGSVELSDIHFGMHFIDMDFGP